MKERKNVFAKETVTVCDKCSGHMMYKGGGCYVCESCGEEYLTDFGKVKRFINTYGPSNAITISRETGVSRHKIQEFLRDGRVEVVEDATNKVAFCLSCGVPIPVSYTHLTLPTIHSVEISGGAGLLKKKKKQFKS